MLTGASQSAMGSKSENEVGPRGDSSANVAEASGGGHQDESRADNLGDAPGALRVAWRAVRLASQAARGGGEAPGGGKGSPAVALSNHIHCRGARRAGGTAGEGAEVEMEEQGAYKEGMETEM